MPNESSAKEITKQGLRSAWFHLRLAESVYIETLTKHGFTFHHAKDGVMFTVHKEFLKANADKCVMTKWLASNEQNNIPKYPFTTIGVGALVTSSDGKVCWKMHPFHAFNLRADFTHARTSSQCRLFGLEIPRRPRRSRYIQGEWKKCHKCSGEHITAAAAREVLEETSVHARIDCMLSLRHHHAYKWNCSDIYIVMAGMASLGDGSSTQVNVA